MLRYMWDSFKESTIGWVLFLITFLVIGVLCALVLHKLFLRLKKYYFNDKQNYFNLWIPSVIGGLLVLPFNLPFCIIIIHFAIIFLIIDLVSSILEKITKKEIRVLKSGLLSIILSSIICIYGILNFLIVVPNEYIIETNKVDREYTIVYISDIHGPLMPMNLFKKYMNEISDIDADFIILGGDITDEYAMRKKMEETYETIGRIKNKNGIFYTYGNHDKLKYTRLIDYDKNILNETILDNGITILKDEQVNINNQITIIGRDDNGSEGKDRLSMEQLLSSVDSDKYVIVVEHEPKDYKNVDSPKVDLFLCGHTHAGQIFPIGFYFRTFWDAFKSGRFKHNNFDIIISSGFGTWAFPFRTEAHSEYVIIKLLPKKV